jgi:hypothetical protein
LTDPGITTASVVVAAKDQISCDLAGEAVVLNLETGIYFGLDEVGASVWRLLERPVSVREICDALMKQYDVERARVETDVVELLTEMMKEGLVAVVPGEASSSV